MLSRSSYTILEDESNAETLVIRDDGPWNLYMTVTNNAENVVAELHASGKLAGRRLFYYDSDGNRDRLLHNNGVFAGFWPGNKESW